MNIQTYQQCIQSLQKEIKSRDQQRKKMSAIIQSLSQQLQHQIQKNKLSREEVNYIMKNNESLVLELHQRERMIQEQRVELSNSQTADQFMKQKTVMLETQKKNFQQELKQRDAIIKETNYRIRDLQVQVKKGQSLVEGYRNILNEKAKEIAKLQTRATQAQIQTDKLALQLLRVKQQFEAQRNQMQFKIQHSKGTVQETITQYQNRIAALLSQLSQTKQLHSNQLSTMQFNHTQQIKQCHAQIAGLKKEALHYIEVIEQMRVHDKQLKRQFDAQTQNKDQVVNQLINEINFLKDQKIQIEKTTQTKLQSVSQEILKIGLQKQEFLEKVQQMEAQIQSKNQQIDKLNTQLTTVKQDKKHYETEYLQQKDLSFKRGQEIFQLKNEVEKLNKSVSAMKKEKESTTNNISRQLTILRQQNIQLQRSLLAAQSQLQQQKIKSIQLQQQIKQLTYERYSTTQNKSQLLQFKKNHQTTIQNLQSMLEQSKKVIAELNGMMKLKLAEIDTLEESNKMFRGEKLEWLKKEDQYRRRIVELRNTGSTGNGRRTIIGGDNHNGNVRNPHRANTEYIKMGIQSIVSSPGGQNNLSLHTSSMLGNTPRHRTITPVNWLQRLHTYNDTDPTNGNIQSSSSNDELSISIPQIHEPYTNSGAYRQQSKSFKMKTSQSHEISEPLSTQPMKKKQKKLHYAVENGQSKSSLKKDYSVGRINALAEKD